MNKNFYLINFYQLASVFVTRNTHHKVNNVVICNFCYHPNNQKKRNNHNNQEVAICSHLYKIFFYIYNFDVDYRNGGTTQGLDTNTFTVETGDGLHLYYQATAPTYPGKLRDGVDIKFNGYVVTAGSLHENGKFYEVVKDIEPAPVMGWC
jgi:hypothetical protein